ncbi:hypothetical protein BJI69_08745 [Luteibacter rhizovicinus DSM 16549]|uniref:Uncharacterized protein n=2 Tax=Luteibacter rhizovicinus TaxID=242606 RepID=A0A0G9H9H6_9GAMM|nr:hypothetical protein BJI69_08745 [Luteibacter rhizovicinus DSM 16549]KLD66465.1 hypothetical protein Y883_13520 [Luteibacter rhizovicinus DSM 16549]KLD78946.1 hypothetical protein Y886_07390 [Xanthomonas hyacinthi DSM 19077]
MKYFAMCCASASLLLSASAVATETGADLLVKGSITPGAACNVVIGSTLNLGTIKRSDLSSDPSKETQLEEQSVPTSVSCLQAQRFAFVVREAGGSDPASDKIFPMRANDDQKRTGKLFLLFDAQSTKVDGVQGYATGADRMIDLGSATWGPATSPRENLPITNGRYAVGFVTEAGSTEAPANIKDLSVKLLVRPWINAVNDLDLNADIGFASDLGLEISYF